MPSSALTQTPRGGELVAVYDPATGKTTPHRVTAWTKALTLVTDARPAALVAAGIDLPARQLIAAR